MNSPTRNCRYLRGENNKLSYPLVRGNAPLKLDSDNLPATRVLSTVQDFATYLSSLRIRTASIEVLRSDNWDLLYKCMENSFRVLKFTGYPSGLNWHPQTERFGR